MTYKRKPNTLNELKRRIDDYFKSRLAPVTDKNGIPLTDEDGKIIQKIVLPYTLTGLALAVGCESREELLSFDNPDMARFVKMSIMKVEEYAEERLFSKEAFSGVKLFLSVNFDRWRDGTDTSDELDGYNIPEDFKKWTV